MTSIIIIIMHFVFAEHFPHSPLFRSTQCTYTIGVLCTMSPSLVNVARHAEINHSTNREPN